MAVGKRVALVGRECVACGCCERVCPKQAIGVLHGVRAEVDGALCVGCGKCAAVCPAAVIRMEERGGAHAEALV